MESDYLRFFTFAPSHPELPLTDTRNILLLRHMAKEGETTEDISPGILELRVLVDPCDAYKKKNKRTKHVIWVVGYNPETQAIYLLSRWAEDSTYSTLVDEMYSASYRWTKHVAGDPRRPQAPVVYMGKRGREILSFALDQRARREVGRPIVIQEFEDDPSITAMTNRIESLEPIFRGQQIWCHTGDTEFIAAFENYPAGSPDELDVLGYLPMTLHLGDSKSMEYLAEQRDAFIGRNSGNAGW
jgi:hypothetical protein